MTIDADTLQKQPAFDHVAIAAPSPTDRQSLHRREAAVHHPRLHGRWVRVYGDGGRNAVSMRGVRGDMPTGGRRTVELGVGRRSRDEGPRLSPDGKWEALIHNFNVAVRPAGARTADAPQHDGSEGNCYELRRSSGRRTRRRSPRTACGPATAARCTTSSRRPRIRLQPKHSCAALRQARRRARRRPAGAVRRRDRKQQIDRRQRALPECVRQCPSSRGGTTAAR